ncbi:Cephalosporin-C deacetylase [Lutibacter oricola]|uniref:Cephalosporin-C deacetylase n=1 Tax=Lutibacter oricola TaxID=762486 RepID=A0A1H2VQE5_9FLAO|nr:acetylxylan esterase [Lutibacter oricola]SDW70510.1 Cephalosporin-C deacetylase [Lutibacter oricola]
MKLRYVFLVLVFSVFSIKAQNLLPFNWEFSYKKDSVFTVNNNVNLLLSWERQGLSYLTPSGKLSTRFKIPKNTNKASYILEVCLLLDVKDIYINGVYIGGDISNKFKWSANPKYNITKFKIPNDVLFIDKENTIEINCSNFSYTGGKSHNSVKFYAEYKFDNSKIEISFNSENHLFEKSSEVLFNLNMNLNSDAELDIFIRNDFADTLFVKNAFVKKNTKHFRIDLSKENLAPGFYEVIVNAKNMGFSGAVSWFTVNPTKIKNTYNKPADFNQFWDIAIAELKTIPPNFKVKKIDSLCTSKRDGFIVEMKSINNLTIRGYYFVPKQKGKYPALLNLPGYGYGFENLDEFLTVDEDVIELAFCVRGHGISDKIVEDKLESPGFFGHQICNKEESAYRQIYMDCIRAVEFLVSREEVDSSKIGVLGGSQGGGLALMTASLASKSISACAYFDPFPTDLKNHLRIRKLINGEIEGFLNFYNNSCDFKTAMNNLNYIDTIHFAKMIKCPTLYITGLFDDDCPPRIGFSAYNKIKSEKKFKIFPNDSHIGESGSKKEMMAFFKDQFKF